MELCQNTTSSVSTSTAMAAGSEVDVGQPDWLARERPLVVYVLCTELCMMASQCPY